MTVGVGETQRTAEPEGALARPVLRRVLAVVIVAAWVAWAVPSWMSSLQEVRGHELVADARAGRVVAFQSVTNVRSHPMRFSALGTGWDADVPAADSTGRPLDGPPSQLVYTVEGSPRMRWLPDLSSGMPDGPEPYTVLRDAGARPFTPETYPPSRDWSAFAALLAFGVALFALVTLPPTRGTRPFWFLSGTVGMGLGILAYAVAELWWRRTEAAAAHTDGPDGADGGDATHGADRADLAGRLRWGHGLLVAVVGGLAAAALRSVIT